MILLYKSKKYFFYISVIAFLLPNFLKSNRDTLKIGLYISEIVEVDHSKEHFKIFFWIKSYQTKYFDSAAQSVDLLRHLDFINVSEFSLNEKSTVDFFDSNRYYSSTKGYVILENSDPGKMYPLDDIKLNLLIDINSSKINQLIIFQDQTEFSSEFNNKINETSDEYEKNKKTYFMPNTLKLKEIPNLNVLYLNHLKTLESSSDNRYLNRICVNLTLSRTTNLFLKLSFVVLISFLLLCVGYLVPLANSDAKFSLILAALLTIIGNKYIVEQNSPVSTQYNLIDIIHGYALLSGLVLVVLTVWEFKYTKLELKKKLFFIVIVVFTGVFTLLSFYWTGIF